MGLSEAEAKKIKQKMQHLRKRTNYWWQRPLGGWNIIWGVISSKCGIKSGYWGSWGNLWWFFLRILGIYSTLGRLGMDWNWLYWPAAIWEVSWGSFIGDAGSYWFAPVFLEQLAFFLRLLILWEKLACYWPDEMYVPDKTGLDGGGMDGPELAGTGSVVPPLALEMY